MTQARPSPRIECPIDLFEGCEIEIQGLTADVNRASTPDDKSRLSRDLLEKVSTLLHCKSYDHDNFNCCLCRDLSVLRHKTATVIDMASALGRKPRTASGAEE